MRRLAITLVVAALSACRGSRKQAGPPPAPPAAQPPHGQAHAPMIAVDVAMLVPAAPPERPALRRAEGTRRLATARGDARGRRGRRRSRSGSPCPRRRTPGGGRPGPAVLEPRAPRCGGAAVAAVAELPDLQASLLARFWSLSAPPRLLRGSLRVDRAQYHVEAELVTAAPADAARLADSLRKLLADDVVLQTAAIGDLAAVLRGVAISTSGAAVRASLALAAADAAALLARGRVVGLPSLPSSGQKKLLPLDVHPDGTLSIAGSYGSGDDLRQVAPSLPAGMDAVLVEYPAGVSHEAVPPRLGDGCESRESQSGRPLPRLRHQPADRVYVDRPLPRGARPRRAAGRPFAPAAV